MIGSARICIAGGALRKYSPGDIHRQSIKGVPLVKFIAILAAIIIAQFPGEVPALAQGAGTATSITIEIKKRKIVGARTIRVQQGDQVQLNWKADEKAKLHLHGYNIEANAVPGKPAFMKFTAKATGRFPVTSHGFGDGRGHSGLIYIEVLPK